MSKSEPSNRWLRLGRVRHLALYTTFHQSRGNKLAHGAFVPVILFTTTVILAHARLAIGGPLGSVAHIATPVAVGLGAVLATIDLAGAALLTAFLLGACALAGALVGMLPAGVLVPVCALLHGLAWYGTVVVGHVRIEPALATEGGPEDSNLYFRRGYYLARDLGTEVGVLDALVQFTIAPLSVVQDGLALLGLRRRLEHDVALERARLVSRLARGEAPLAVS